MGLLDDFVMPGPTKYKFICDECGGRVEKPRTPGYPHLGAKGSGFWAVRINDDGTTTDHYNDPAWLHEHPEFHGDQEHRLCYGQPPADKPYGVL